MAINTPKHVWNEESNGILNAMYLVMLSEDMPSETENSWKSESLLILGLQQFHTFDIGYGWMERSRFNDSPYNIQISWDKHTRHEPTLAHKFASLFLI